MKELTTDLWVAVQNIQKSRDYLRNLPKSEDKKKLTIMREISMLETEIQRLSNVKEELIKLA